MYEKITSFVSGITAIIGIFALLLFFKLLSTWKKIDMNYMKARVFLADKFILNTFIIIFITGCLIAFHNFMEFLSLSQSKFVRNYIFAIFPVHLIAVSALFIALLLIVWLMYNWIRIAKKP